MTNDEEENLIRDQLSTARMAVEAAERAKRQASDNLAVMKENLAQVQQAALDYMKGNGLVECDAFRLRKSYRVNVENIDAVPDEYKRTKTTIEPDKAKIRANKPEGNWYIMEESETVEIKEEKR